MANVCFLDRRQTVPDSSHGIHKDKLFHRILPRFYHLGFPPPIHIYPPGQAMFCFSLFPAHPETSHPPPPPPNSLQFPQLIQFHRTVSVSMVVKGVQVGAKISPTDRIRSGARENTHAHTFHWHFKNRHIPKLGKLLTYFNIFNTMFDRLE